MGNCGNFTKILVLIGGLTIDESRNISFKRTYTSGLTPRNFHFRNSNQATSTIQLPSPRISDVARSKGYIFGLFLQNKWEELMLSKGG